MQKGGSDCLDPPVQVYDVSLILLQQKIDIFGENNIQLFSEK